MLVVGNLDWFDRGTEIRQMIARAALDFRTDITCWQDAWNALTGATPQRPGTLRLGPGKCSECHGRRWSHNSVARGNRNGICLTCHGNGKSRPQSFTALYAKSERDPAQS